MEGNKVPRSGIALLSSFPGTAFSGAVVRLLVKSSRAYISIAGQRNFLAPPDWRV